MQEIHKSTASRGLVARLTAFDKEQSTEITLFGKSFAESDSTFKNPGSNFDYFKGNSFDEELDALEETMRTFGSEILWFPFKDGEISNSQPDYAEGLSKLAAYFNPVFRDLVNEDEVTAMRQYKALVEYRAALTSFRSKADMLKQEIDSLEKRLPQAIHNIELAKNANDMSRKKNAESELYNLNLEIANIKDNIQSLENNLSPDAIKKRLEGILERDVNLPELTDNDRSLFCTAMPAYNIEYVVEAEPEKPRFLTARRVGYGVFGLLAAAAVGMIVMTGVTIYRDASRPERTVQATGPNPTTPKAPAYLSVLGSLSHPKWDYCFALKNDYRNLGELKIGQEFSLYGQGNVSYLGFDWNTNELCLIKDDDSILRWDASKAFEKKDMYIAALASDQMQNGMPMYWLRFMPEEHKVYMVEPTSSDIVVSDPYLSAFTHNSTDPKYKVMYGNGVMAEGNIDKPIPIELAKAFVMDQRTYLLILSGNEPVPDGAGFSITKNIRELVVNNWDPVISPSK